MLSARNHTCFVVISHAHVLASFRKRSEYLGCCSWPPSHLHGLHLQKTGSLLETQKVLFSCLLPVLLKHLLFNLDCKSERKRNKVNLQRLGENHFLCLNKKQEREEGKSTSLAMQGRMLFFTVVHKWSRYNEKNLNIRTKRMNIFLRYNREAYCMDIQAWTLKHWTLV